MSPALRVAIVVSCVGIVFACDGTTGPAASFDTVATTESAVTTSIDVDIASGRAPDTDASVAPTKKLAILRYRPYPEGLVIPDPTLESASNAFLFAEVFSGLTKPSHLDLDEIEPDLAESYVVSDDGLEYTFRLRAGAKFSDGTPVSVHDVKWSWERALRPETRSARAIETLGMIDGASAVANGLVYELAGLTAVDEVTFTVRLVRPHADFLWLLADPVASVLKRSNAEKWATAVDWVSGYFNPDFVELPVGTGPFRVVAMDLLADDVVLDPNPHYWDGSPALDYVVYDFFDGIDYSMNSWLVGNYDNGITTYNYCEGFSTLGDYTRDGVPVWLIASESPSQVSYLAFNTAVAPFDGVEFRQALVASAMPGSYEIEPYLGIPEAPASGLLPPGFPAHSGRSVTSANQREYAVMKLQSSAYFERPDQFQIRFIPDEYGLFSEDFDALSTNWRDWLGVDVGPTELPTAKWQTEFHQMLRDGTLQMRYMNLRPRYPSPHAILGAIPGLFGPNAQSPETIVLQQMIDDAAAEQDSVRRLAMYQDIEQHILDRALVLPMFWDEGGRCNEVQDWVTEFRVPKWGGSLFSNVVIDTEHPAYPNRTAGN